MKKPFVYARDYAIEWEVGDIVYYPTTRFDTQKEFLEHLTKYDCFYATEDKIDINDTYVLTKCFVHEVIEVPEELLLELGEDEADESEPRQLMCVLEPLTRDEDNPSDDAWVGGFDMLAQVYRDPYYFGGMLTEDDLPHMKSGLDLIYREVFKQVKDTETFEKLYMDNLILSNIKKGYLVRSISDLEQHVGKEIIENAALKATEIYEKLERKMRKFSA